MILQNYYKDSRKQVKEAEKELIELANKKHSMTPEEANQIVNDLGTVIMLLTNGKTHYLYYPESLLPKEKPIVLEAIAVCYKHTKPNTPERNDILDANYYVRMVFVKDKIANKYKF